MTPGVGLRSLTGLLPLGKLVKFCGLGQLTLVAIQITHIDAVRKVDALAAIPAQGLARW